MEIKKVLVYAVALLFKPFPRNKHLWITGKVTPWGYKNSPPAFFDNSKYFFLYLVNQTDEKVYWISSSREEIVLLKSMGLPVVRFPSIKGIWLTLRANFFFHHYGTDQISYSLQMGAIQLDFWHGTPLKKIRYDIVEKLPEKNSFLIKIMKKGGKEYVFSTSKYLSEKILASAFAVEMDKLLNFAYPRMDVIGLTKKDNLNFCKKYSPELLSYIEMAEKHNKVFLYMPTYRDDDPEYFEKATINFRAMSDALKEVNGIFFLKLHPLTKYSTLKDFDNIVQISNNVDIYPFLIYTTYLVTDYSSIYFDYLLLDKEIIFIPYDYANYISKRELYFDYDEITPGVKFHNFDEFIKAIKNLDSLDYAEERRKVCTMMIEDYHFDACKRTFQFIKEKYQKIH